MTYFFKFWDPLHISATVEARNFKFGMEIGRWGPKRIKCKIRSKGVVKGQVTYFLKFWDPFIYRERLKLKTSNLAHRLAIGVLSKKCKIRSKGVVKWSRDLLFKFCDTLHISRTVKLETSNLACRLDTGGPNEKMQN